MGGNGGDFRTATEAGVGGVPGMRAAGWAAKEAIAPVAGRAVGGAIKVSSDSSSDAADQR
jgi:hypothetical protein